jgi:serine/threonine protein kinase
LKDVPKLIFNHFNEEVRPNLRDSPFIRLPVDTVSDQRILVFKYLKEDLLTLVRKKIPTDATKRILKDSLKGLAEMHDQDIIHLGNATFHDRTLPKLTGVRHKGRQHHG